MLTGDPITMSDLIGFFDSGVGGISVLHEARRLLPNEHFLFYGDNLHAPYGPRPLAEIRALSAEGIGHLLSRDGKAIVIACNTATSAYAEIVRAAHPELPIVGMEPALKPAHFARHGGKVIVLATDATLRLEKFERLMRLYGDDVITVVGRGLVELVESGKARAPEATAQLEALLGPYRGMQIDAVVLGCTHYPFLKPVIASIAGPGVQIIDPAPAVARQTVRMLEKDCIPMDEGPFSIDLYFSGEPDSLRRVFSIL